MRKMKKKISLHAGVKTKPWELQQRLNFAALVETCPEGLLGHLKDCCVLQAQQSCTNVIWSFTDRYHPHAMDRLGFWDWDYPVWNELNTKNSLDKGFSFPIKESWGVFFCIEEEVWIFQRRIVWKWLWIFSAWLNCLAMFQTSALSLMPCVPILCTAALGASRENGHLDICALRLCSTDRDLVHSWTWFLSKQKGEGRGSSHDVTCHLCPTCWRVFLLSAEYLHQKIRIWGFHWMTVW